VVPYGGARYPDRVPDTLDLAERAALAMNGLTGPLDPNADYELYWWVEFLYNPPVMSHDWNDWCGYPHHTEKASCQWHPHGQLAA
jgi:hypothetical protein